ncbi:MAG TPA: hypothetical protein VFN03_13525 [Trueperaceae bacterium]|nr:hypothetical protein [Trueperaceae bacterium]
MTTGKKQASGLVGLGSRGYALIKKSLGLYGTTVALVQLLPAVLALVVVAFTPSALLSPTLRRWMLAGSLSGSLVGMLLFASRAGLRGIHVVLRGGSAKPTGALGRLARTGLVIAAGAFVVLRLHLALVDTTFIQQFTVLTPVFDYYLSGRAFAGVLFNGVAAILTCVMLAGLVAGAPAALLNRREARRRRAQQGERSGALGAVEDALAALEKATKALERARDDLALAAIAHDLGRDLTRATEPEAEPETGRSASQAETSG